jgi:hypothetical protein
MDTNLTLQQQKIASLVGAIYENDYYVNLFERVCGDAAALPTNPAAIRLLNDFWFRLPDNTSIRTPVFFQLCDIIEGEEDEGCPCGEDGGTSCGDPNCGLLTNEPPF